MLGQNGGNVGAEKGGGGNQGSIQFVQFVVSHVSMPVVCISHPMLPEELGSQMACHICCRFWWRISTKTRVDE